MQSYVCYKDYKKNKKLNITKGIVMNKIKRKIIHLLFLIIPMFFIISLKASVWCNAPKQCSLHHFCGAFWCMKCTALTTGISDCKRKS